MWLQLEREIAEEFDRLQDPQHADVDAKMYLDSRRRAHEYCACGNYRGYYCELCDKCAEVHRAETLAKHHEKAREVRRNTVLPFELLWAS